MPKFLPLVLAVFLLGGCVTPTQTIKPLAEANKGARNIETVTVSYSGLSNEQLLAMDQKLYEKGQQKAEPGAIKYQPLKEALQKIVKEHLEERDNSGDLYANVHVEIDNLKLANPLTAVLLGDTDQLAGTVQVYDPQTKETLTEFYVDVIEGSGGLLGLAIRGGGVREKLSLHFSNLIGDELGFQKIEAQPIERESGPNQ